MPTTQSDIRAWFKQGVEKDATHMAVYTDTFDWSDYPVYFTAEDAADAERQVLQYMREHAMTKLMEVYHLGSPMEAQTNTRTHVFNYAPVG